MLKPSVRAARQGRLILLAGLSLLLLPVVVSLRARHSHGVPALAAIPRLDHARTARDAAHAVLRKPVKARRPVALALNACGTKIVRLRTTHGGQAVMVSGDVILRAAHERGMVLAGCVALKDGLECPCARSEQCSNANHAACR